MSAAGRVSFRTIKAEILRRIAAREWPAGAKLPVEAELAAEFGAARATVNRALQELAGAGLLERRRRRGTRVALNPVREARLAIPLVRHEVEASGFHYGYRLLRREKRQARDCPGISPAASRQGPALHIECLHLADGNPCRYEDRWIFLEIVPDADAESFEHTGPNEWLVENAPLSQAEIVFSAAIASVPEAAALGQPPGSAVFVAERTTWLGDAEITWVRMLHPQGYRLVSRL